MTPPDTDMPDRDTLIAWDKAHLWHPFTAQKDWHDAEPLIIARGEGVHLFDDRGRRYLDGVGSLWCNVHGHRHPRLDAAIRQQLDRVAHTTLLGATHPPAIELARRLVELAPEGLSRVFFSDDGATAVEVALKMAFQFWRQKDQPEPGRTRFVSLGGAYHGDTLGDVSVGAIDRFHAVFRPLLFDVLRAPIPHCYRCPLGLARPDCQTACLEAVERILESHPGEVAAVVVEPLVQGAAGMVVHPEGYLRGLRELTRRHDTLLIADEVAVGFGRTGTMFACEQEGVTPDFLCLGKGITGGYLPLAATLTTERVYAAFFASAAEDRTFQHGHTYGGNPLGAAVALASLEVFEAEQTLEATRRNAAVLKECLDRIARLPHVGDVRQRGLIAGIELVEDRPTKRPFPRARMTGARVCLKARAHGLLIRPLGDVIVVFPPLAIRPEQLRQMMETIERCIRSETDPGARDPALTAAAALHEDLMDDSV
jgi:adenosylmethionine-8-amino-7-oxononanoate aminotransferase